MKPLEILVLVLSAVSLLGALTLMYVLGVVGAALANFETTLAGLPSLDPSSSQSFLDQMRSFLTLGWLWSVAVLLSSAYSLWNGVKKLRSGK